MMKLFMALLMSLSVWAANPKTYAPLGNTIYDAMPQIETLSQIESMKKYRQGMNDFLKTCNEIKQEGLALDRGHSIESERLGYLHKLRTLVRERDFFVDAAHRVLEKTMASEDYVQFSKLIETGLINTARKRKAITDFYTQHRGEHTLNELEKYRLEDEAARERAERQKMSRQAWYKKQKEARLERINRRQKEAKEAYKREVDEEAERQKLEAHEMQERELKLNR